MKLKTSDMAISAIFAAIICVFSSISIPVGVIPLTLGLFAVLLSAITLGSRRSLLCVLVYILTGSLGLPVFGNFSGGFGVILGPTGGFILSYPFVALIAAILSKKLSQNKKGILCCIAGCLVALLFCYLFGTLYFMLTLKSTFSESISICVLPFVAFDILKCIFASIIGLNIKKRLISII